MPKMITSAELGSLVATLLRDPSSVGQDMTAEAYARFMADIATAVCNACGGEVIEVAFSKPTGSGDEWCIDVHGNDSLPEDGGVWSQFDPGNGLFPTDRG